jgi:DNA polymerase III subunit delta
MNLDIWKKINKKQFGSIYLLYGTEQFLINQTKDLIVEHALEEDEKDFNLSIIDLEEVPVEVALEDAETLPFIGERRVVILKNPYFLTADKGKEKVEHNIAKLEKYINEPAPFSIIVIMAPYEKLDERKKISKLLKRQAEVLEANALNEKDLTQWVIERAKTFDVTFQGGAIQELIQLTGTNLMIITQEVDKICLYVGKGGSVTEEVIHLLVPRSLEQNIFTLIEKIVQRKLAEALRIFYDLIQNNEEPIKILSLLATQFRLIYQVKELARRGYGQPQIAGNLKVHPFRVKLAAGQARLFSDAELASIINELAEMDYEIKNGKIDKKLSLEMFIMKLAR